MPDSLRRATAETRASADRPAGRLPSGAAVGAMEGRTGRATSMAPAACLLPAPRPPGKARDAMWCAMCIAVGAGKGRGHGFHAAQCLCRWAMVKLSCPTDRSPIAPSAPRLAPFPFPRRAADRPCPCPCAASSSSSSSCVGGGDGLRQRNKNEKDNK